MQIGLSALQPEQLARMFDTNPTRKVTFKTGTLSAEQSVILATRPYPVNLTFCWDGTRGFALEDEGTAFVNALEKRTSPFGSLTFRFPQFCMPFTNENMKRLLKFGIFDDELSLFSILNKECATLPFTANVNVLEYEIAAGHVKATDFDALDIATKNLDLTVYLDPTDQWDEILVAFFNRVAELGHFESLSFRVKMFDMFRQTLDLSFSRMKPFAEALIRVTHANQKLTTLCLTAGNFTLDWAMHLKPILQSMENHKGLRAFEVDE